MYKLDLKVDGIEAAAIERRRKMEEDRKARVFNAKNRLIGVDNQALEQQVKERLQMEEREKLRSEAFDADRVRDDRIACMLEARQNQDVRELNKAQNEFRQLHQQPQDRREWDLYEPDYLKKDKPARVSDDDPRCGISSLQKFDGEDLNNKARNKFQQEQRREWSVAQQRERDQAAHAQKRADDLYQNKQRELDARAQELQRAEEECRKRINEATSDYNKALARERSERERLQAQQTLDDNKTEMMNHIYGDLLTENPAVAQSAFGPNRVIPDRWKGMSPEQLEDIRRTQEQQRKEKERLDTEAKLRDAEHDRQRVAQARAAQLLEREAERSRRELDRNQAAENKRLSVEQKQHLNYLDQQVYTNEPTAAYFMQFNTSSR